MNDFLQGSVVYGDINTPETHFSVKYDNIPHNQVEGRTNINITITKTHKFASDPNSLWKLLEVVYD